MKCPKCKREIAYEQTVCKCGWSAVVSRPEPRKPIERLKPVSAEHKEELQRLLKGYRLNARAKIEREPAKRFMHEVTPGHGNTCCCELCWPIRMKTTKGRVDGSDMPVE